jgi:hypothetical protein
MDEIDENPSRLGEEQGVLSATSELYEYLALSKVRQNNPGGIAFDVLVWYWVHSCRYLNVARMARGLLHCLHRQLELSVCSVPQAGSTGTRKNRHRRDP